MLKHHLLVALRALRRRPGTSFINVAGLGLGLACFAVIMLFVKGELSYDRHHADADRIFRVALTGYPPNSEPDYFAVTGSPVGRVLRQDFPEVESVVRITDFTAPVTIGSTTEYEQAMWYAEPDLFDVFTLPLVRGSREGLLEAPRTMVVTESTARRLFGEENPVGKSVVVSDTMSVAVQGVIADFPASSHFRTDYIVSWSTAFEDSADDNGWLSLGLYTYVKLRENVDPAAFGAKIKPLVEERFAESLSRIGFKADLNLEPLTGIYLHSKLRAQIGPVGDMTQVWVFSAIALFVLILAIINFTNLATARSMERAREVGVRKVSGIDPRRARHPVPVRIGRAGALRALHRHRTHGGRASAPELPRRQGNHVCDGLRVAQPGDPLRARGRVRHPRRIVPRRRAVRSKEHLRAQGPDAFYVPRGAPAEGSGVAPVRRLDRAHRRNRVCHAPARFHAIAGSRLQPGARDGGRGLVGPGHVEPGIRGHDADRIRAAGLGRRVVGLRNAPRPRSGRLLFNAEGLSEDDARSARFGLVGYDWFENLGIPLAAGRTFSPDFPTDRDEAVVITRMMVDYLGWGTPEQALGKTMDVANGPHRVVGVVEDYHHSSLKEAVDPLFFLLRPAVANFLSLRLAPGDPQAAVAETEATWTRMFPGTPFTWFFLDQDYNRQYQSEDRLKEISSIFSLLAIVIACLGLVGLAAFTAQQRTKEVGVRKVLGASTSGLVALLSREFAVLVLVGLAIAVPLTAWGMHRWLGSFPYRISLEPFTFLAAGLLALAFALLSVGWQAVRVARSNPVESLRYE